MQDGRLLQEAPKPATPPLSSGTPTGPPKVLTPPPKKKTAKLVFNSDLFKFYDEITVLGPETGSHIFRISDPPIDLDNVPKTFGIGTGINILEYHTRFSIPPDTFYKMLFTYRKPDVPDTNLLFFLVDFN